MPKVNMDAASRKLEGARNVAGMRYWSISSYNILEEELDCAANFCDGLEGLNSEAVRDSAALLGGSKDWYPWVYRVGKHALRILAELQGVVFACLEKDSIGRLAFRQEIVLKRAEAIPLPADRAIIG